MFLAPISKAVPKGASNSSQSKSRPHDVKMLANRLSIFLVVLALAASAGRAIAQSTPPQFDDLAARAAAARDSGNIPQAIDLYNQAAQLKPDWAEGWFYLGLLQYNSNSFQPAIEAFNHFLQLQPNAPPAMALRGLCEFETGAYDDALRDLDTAVNKGAANEPRNEQIIRYHLAQLLARDGRFQDALTQYQFFAVKQMDDPDLLLGIGLAGMRSTALPKDIPANAKPILEEAGRAGYVFLSGDSQGGDTAFRQLFDRYPKMPNLHFFFGILLFTHAPDLAIPQFQDEVAISPSNAAAHAILGYSLMMIGRFEEAKPEAELALAGAPGMEMAKIALGHALAETGDPARAAELLNQVLQGDPNNLEAHLGLAALYSRTGNREEASRERKLCLNMAR
jgi:tetratricopeptide (TPR) repeat protein